MKKVVLWCYECECEVEAEVGLPGANRFIKEIRFDCEERDCEKCALRFYCLTDIDPIEIYAPELTNMALHDIMDSVEDILFDDGKGSIQVRVVWTRKV